MMETDLIIPTSTTILGSMEKPSVEYLKEMIKSKGESLQKNKDITLEDINLLPLI